MSAGFQCKQFFVAHDQCAMKVGTDALLLGAWVELTQHGAMLDIGCGSGIISLMLAQRSVELAQRSVELAQRNAEKHQLPAIFAIELDAAAAAQAASNFAASTFAGQLTLIKGDILTYQPHDRYALIVSNPPFFQDALPSCDPKRQQARHTDSLPFSALLNKAASLLAPGGEFCVVLPAASQSAFTKAAVLGGWQCQRLCAVQSKTEKPVSRYLQSWRVIANSNVDRTQLPVTSALIIHSRDGDYSEAYRKLLNAFYLKF